ncbi:hypothetical protein IM792_12380 [Mucilaginibacter sp. JRF]|uniref:hypothetical protein n=1 Tax=Mucilaginibacter sp. JRF TaxID=2780088 RepID=UPI00187E6625|nr:hypothetical protein [Mucilaginibacter sp. JRF]MBE9585249.1 hypothetical protein [Mucilaginibacter sp. JRF]
MKTNFIYNRYKACIHSANWIFNHYYKYSNCYAIKSDDEEMQTILKKIAIAYARLIRFVALRKKSVLTEPAITDVIDESEVLLKDKHSIFLKLSHFLNANYDLLVKVFDSKRSVSIINKEIETLEDNLDHAGQLVGKMDVMLKSSQHVYNLDQKRQIA